MHAKQLCVEPRLHWLLDLGVAKLNGDLMPQRRLERRVDVFGREAREDAREGRIARVPRPRVTREASQGVMADAVERASVLEEGRDQIGQAARIVRCDL
ncbi:MAG TPA: hypothetical protein DEF51_32310 [Myxococcales bacterium]|nr:hypothetical protein [Myxococcales bacterium]